MNYPWPYTDADVHVIFRSAFHPESTSELTRIYTTAREHGHSVHDAFRWSLEQLVITDAAIDHVRIEWLDSGITDDQIDAFLALLSTSGHAPTGSLYEDLTLVCGYYSRVCQERWCCGWAPFSDVPGWESEVLKLLES